MRQAIGGVGFALLIATAPALDRHGNLLPAWVQVVCVDINPPPSPSSPTAAPSRRSAW
jgi:hypothetical protein